MRRLSVLKALLAERDRSGLDGVHNSRALRRDFDISLLSEEEDSHRQRNRTEGLY